jgi:hypothetical protein
MPALAVHAIAAEPDPIFTAIEAHRAAPTVERALGLLRTEPTSLAV